jgi:hypothetical protein
MLSADLAFHFVCKEALRGDLEKAIEQFLRSDGFRVLKLTVLQRQRDAVGFETNVVALDHDQRMIEIRSVHGADQRYSVALYSRPPTNHLASLERDILEFVSEHLKCENRQVQRHDNSEEQKDFFESEVRRVQNLFEEADRMNGRLRL